MEDIQWFAAEVLRPIADVGILAFILYKTYQLLAKTQAMQMMMGVGFLALVYGFATVFKLSTLQWLLTVIGPGLVVAVVVVFQPELRKLILKLGQTEFFRLGDKAEIGELGSVVTAAELLSQKRPKPRGMLVVFPRRVNVQHIIDTGTRLDAKISSQLIVAVFEFDGPLHDCAMVIHKGRIVAAGCLLPVSEQQDIKKSFGSRHRAALGMSEQSDAVILVVSEETGAMSIALDGRIYYDLSALELTRMLQETLGRSKAADTLTLPEAHDKEEP